MKIVSVTAVEISDTKLLVINSAFQVVDILKWININAENEYPAKRRLHSGQSFY